MSEGDLEIVFEYVNTLSPRVVTTSDSSRRVEVFEPGKSIDDLAPIAQKSGVRVDDILLANRAVYQDDLSSLVSPTPNLLPIRITSTGRIAQTAQTAQRVRSDLQKLSNVDTAASSMAEIHAWTSVRVNCFVNILKPSNNDAAAQNPSTQFLEGCGQGARWRRAEIVELQCDSLATEKSKSRFHEVDLVRDFLTVMHGSHRAWKDP